MPNADSSSLWVVGMTSRVTTHRRVSALRWRGWQPNARSLHCATRRLPRRFAPVEMTVVGRAAGAAVAMRRTGEDTCPYVIHRLHDGFSRVHQGWGIDRGWGRG